MSVMKTYPFVTYAVFCILGFVLINYLEGTGAGYDDGGTGGIAFLLSMCWNVLAFPFYLSSEFLFLVSGGGVLPGHMIFASAMGVTICILAEFVITKRRRAIRGAA